ncbi:TetR/AcrR family transcriptional regulator [Microbacterium sp. LRZ72]|uniref:TetR family transcriptional regulator n=1 Tax=Microbacterium sp. LRZ72 TaxID=2942481 RepID=UPI0029B2549D|nr:TetR family transcriptional regulator [Microbacterium sp. LRZ72]MDX2375587.1 TetR/AcrR family transcriptional regulator [Microbacterium sp. LRZ72]
MTLPHRPGRPRASSRDMLAEAACELFLENGYESTSVADITRRAGVSRSTFFNYFSSKADVVWGGLDERIVALEARLSEAPPGDAPEHIRAGIAELAAGFVPDTLALALLHATTMGFAGELEREASVRRARIGRAVAQRMRRDGAERLRADVVGAAVGGGVLAAIEVWAQAGPDRPDLTGLVERVLGFAGL